MHHLRRILNPTARIPRWIRKTLLLALLTVGVLYPDPRLLVRHVHRWMDISALGDPTTPALDAMAAELAPHLEGVESAGDALAIVEQFVLEKIPYGWDWDVWGVVDYVPTVEETIEAGREDCDGRAVLAAALLRRFGYEAHIVTDLTHVWVWTPAGETMSPNETASGHTVVEADESGSRVNPLGFVHPQALLVDMPRALAYGIAVFPLWREVVLVAGAWCCLLGRLPRPRREIATAILLAGGLLALHQSGESGALWLIWLGLGTWSGAALLALRRSHPPAAAPTPDPADADPE